ncbi:serine/threonine-protein kinase [Pseudonocardia acaciae]|uniref:serine/threonine-protein kinase n=1 Tax=Pseudonocardia acaciae TaxID=551276 RepID=UPI000A0369A6|nr:serine/threonine-protein kinase [Pseudonocardia acaciae]
MEAGEELFGRYRLVRSIARGGMGTVWEAEDILLAQRVALKHVSFADLPAEQAALTRARTLREAKMAAQLRGHPHVIAIYDVIESDGDVWLVLEYLPSASLTETLTTGRRLRPAEIARIGAAVADALAAAHARGIVHRDVKPGNILIGADHHTVKLTDFGISHAATDDNALTHVGVVSGTPTYMAREVARGEPSTPASDIFSLGATLYRAAEGSPPFGEDPNTNRLLLRVATGPINAPTTRTPLTPLIMRLLEFNPSTRPDAATTRDQLHVLSGRLAEATYPPLDEHYGPTTPPGGHRPPPLPAPRPPRKPRRWLVVAAIAAFALAAGLAVALPKLLDNGPPTGVPPLPTAVGPITLSGDPRAADPCALIDPTWLRQFGQPVITTNISYTPEACQARITVPNGDMVLDVKFNTPKTVSDLGGQPQQLGDLTIVRRSVQTGLFVTSCDSVILLADRTAIYFETNGPDGSDICGATEVATAVAVNRLARDGITYRPGRTAEWLITSNDACAVLDPATLAAVPGLDTNIRFPGFGNWSCTWGATQKDASRLYMGFRLDNVRVDDYGNDTTIAGRRAWTKISRGDKNPAKCHLYVITRPAPTAMGATEMLELSLEGPQPAAELCARGSEVAATALTKLH